MQPYRRVKRKEAAAQDSCSSLLLCGTDREWLPLLTGCGTQHPHRALGGTRVLLAAAPTTPPCFRRWRRSSSLLAMFSGKIIFNFAFGATAFAERSAAMKAPVGLLSGRAVCVSRWRGFAPTSSAERSKRYFHERVRREKRHLQRRFLRKRGAAGSILALSVIAARCHLSQRERPWHSGKVSG